MTRAWLSRRPAVILTLVAGLLAVAVTSADAQPTSAQARSTLEEARTQLDLLENEFNGVVDAYNEAEERLEQAREKVAEAEAELATLRRENEELSLSTATHVRQLHKFGPAVELSTLLGSDDPNAASDKAAALRRALTGRQADLQSLSATRVTLEAAEARLIEDEKAAEAAAADVAEKRDAIENKIEEQQSQVAHYQNVLNQAIAREEAARRAAEQEAARRAAEERRQQRLAQQQSSRSTSRTSSGSSQATTTQASTPASPAPAPRANAQVAVDAALSKVGSPYRWGATGPNAFDCSGLVVWAWRQAGVSLPRTSAGQFANLRRISRSELQPGDLVFSGTPGVHHVGMYIGNGQIVHAPRSGVPVEVRSMQRPDIRGYGRPG